jgi:hypothetical protein
MLLPNPVIAWLNTKLSGPLAPPVQSNAAAPNAARLDQGRFLEQLGDAWLSYLGGFVPPGRRVLLKDPSVCHLETFFSFFPREHLLVITRDGRDLVSSALNASFMVSEPFSIWRRRTWHKLIHPDFLRVTRRYAAAARTIADFERSEAAARHAAQYLRISYEALYGDPEGEIRKVLAWAGLDADRYDWDALTALPVRGSSFLRDASGQIDFGRGQPRTGDFRPLGRWKQWSPSQRRIFDREAGEATRSIGYDYRWEEPPAARSLRL